MDNSGQAGGRSGGSAPASTGAASIIVAQRAFRPVVGSPAPGPPEGPESTSVTNQPSAASIVPAGLRSQNASPSGLTTHRAPASSAPSADRAQTAQSVSAGEKHRPIGSY